MQAICDYVHDRITFGYEHARSTRTAWDGFMERKGVCRDFAHLAVTFCRCMNIPARYATGYLGDVALLEDDLAFLVANHGRPQVPFDLVERIDPFAREHAVYSSPVAAPVAATARSVRPTSICCAADAAAPLCMPAPSPGPPPRSPTSRPPLTSVSRHAHASAAGRQSWKFRATLTIAGKILPRTSARKVARR